MEVNNIKPKFNNEAKINKTLKGVLINNHVKTYDGNKVSFDDIHDSLLVCDGEKAYNRKDTKIKGDESSFNISSAMKPLLIGTTVIALGSLLLSAVLKKSSKNLINSKSFEQLPDLAVNMNIKEETHFALYRAIRDPNFKNIMAMTGVFLMSAVTIGCKNFIDGAKEIWIKKRESDIEKNLQENLIKVETDSFSGKLNYVNELMNTNIKYFDEVLNDKEPAKKELFSEFPSFSASQDENKKESINEKLKNKNVKYLLFTMSVAVLTLLLGKMSLDNLRKTFKNTQKFANNYTEKTIDAIKNISEKSNKDDIPKITELFKSICAKPEFIQEIGEKYHLSPKETERIIKTVNDTKKTIFADAPTALGGIPKKIQYYCYLDENRGHLYNWLLNTDNKFTKYIFTAFTVSSAIGYMFKQSMDAIKETAVLNENAKTELNLRKRLVDVEVNNFKSKKQSAVNPLIENFNEQIKEGKKSKEELKQLADNILTEIKNGPPYVYT